MPNDLNGMRQGNTCNTLKDAAGITLSGETSGKMDLSVIIVNFNVKYFLEQCLHAVMMAIQNIETEVIVVDNCSADGSVGMIRERFPQVKVLANEQNVGFAKANNQAISVSSGRYILLLNPDTVVQEDTFSRCLGYMDVHPDTGCLGVKMIDGKGNFLPESKRALPTPLVAFYKVFGLSALFPRSRSFGKYHLTYLNSDEIHQVDVISGAFMFINRQALEKTGLLDEDFFMYGEDIDLSYRFILAGYSNVYFPKTTIIHYKGESTKKSSINYVLIFYRAMIIFARKHFNKSTFRYYSLFIHLAIYFRAGISILSRFIRNIILPVMDATLIYAGYLLLQPVWARHHFGQTGYYPGEFLTLAVPAYIIIWMLMIFIFTGYGPRVKIPDLLRGVFLGTLVILVGYALLPESWRFSRALIVLGTLWTLCATISIRYLLSRVNPAVFSLESFKRRKKIILIGDKNENDRVYSIIKQTQVVPELIGYVNVSREHDDPMFIGHIGRIEEIVRVNGVDEIIFCAASMSSQDIIRTMLQFTHSDLEFKIAPPESLSVIGSNSIDTSGELYVLHFNTLSRRLNKRKKRLFDVILSLTILAVSPIMVFLVKHPAGMIRNIFGILVGVTSWVGYYHSTGGNHPGLPFLKPGVLTPLDVLGHNKTDEASAEQANLLYAKDYRIIHDLKIILHNYPLLGRKPIMYREAGFK